MSVSVLIVTFAAFITPMVLQRFKISVLPTAVAEVLVGIVLGKSGFDLVQTEGILSFLSNYGSSSYFLEWDGDRLFYFQEK